MSYSSVTVGTGTPVLIVAANTQRKSVIITNEGASKVYLGNDSSITTASAVSLESDGKWTEDDSGGHRVYLGDIYGIAEDGSCNVHYWERV